MGDLPDFPILDVSGWTVDRDESVGSKRKVWLIEPSSGRRWLFKHLTDPMVGEDWAEKLACEIAELLGLPHARVELAGLGLEPGSISLDFTDGRARGDLVLGRRLLSEQDDRYPAGRTFRNAEHTAQRIADVLGQAFIGIHDGVPSFVTDARDLFVGYLMLDALIANTDRHHENWGLLHAGGPGPGVTVLAPTFDHASSLGRELQDETRRRRLATRDKGFSVHHYAVEKARSAIYDEASPVRPMSPLAAFDWFAREFCAAARGWVDRLRGIQPRHLHAIVSRVPTERMSDCAKDFACRMLDATYSALTRFDESR